MNNSFLPFLWFLAILALIPVALWLLKRTPMGGSAAGNHMRMIGVLPIAPNQRIVTVEVGQGEDRKWLVLGVTGQQISTLHVMPPQADVPTASGGPLNFAQILSSKLKSGTNAGDQRAP
jgi:flagellar protein FliO/FliZ